MAGNMREKATEQGKPAGLEHDFRMDTGVCGKKEFLGRIGGLFAVALVLGGLCVIGCAAKVLSGILEQTWRGNGAAAFGGTVLLTGILALLFGSLVKTAVDERPFSATLSQAVSGSGLLLSLASVVLPRLQGYRSSGFELFSSGDFVLVDGVLLTAGLFFLVIGRILMEGFRMQKEMDEIL